MTNPLDQPRNCRVADLPLAARRMLPYRVFFYMAYEPDSRLHDGSDVRMLVVEGRENTWLGAWDANHASRRMHRAGALQCVERWRSARSAVIDDPWLVGTHLYNDGDERLLDDYMRVVAAIGRAAAGWRALDSRLASLAHGEFRPTASH